MGFFDANRFPIYTIKYEGGIPDFNPAPGTIQFKEDYAELKLMVGFSRETITIKPDDIIEIGLNQDTFRSAGKAAAGAIVGGLLTGGIGLIAGAAIGGKRRKENQLHLIIKYMKTDCEVLIAPNNNTLYIYSGLKALAKQQTSNITLQTQETNNHENDAIAEIERLHELLQKGILTQEEFNTKKKQLLRI
jgi:hypothetical protein